MNKQSHSTTKNTTRKVPVSKPQMMRVMSEAEKIEHIGPGYSAQEISALLYKSRRVAAFNIEFSDGRKEFFDFRRPA